MHCPNNYALSHDSFGPTLSFTVTNREQSAVYLINSSERKFKGASAKRHKQNAAELPSRSRRCEGRNAEPGPVRTERAANPGLPGTGRCETRVERGCSAGTGTTAAVSGERQRGTAAPARRRRNHAGSAEPRFGSPVTNPGRGASSAGPVPARPSALPAAEKGEVAAPAIGGCRRGQNGQLAPDPARSGREGAALPSTGAGAGGGSPRRGPSARRRLPTARGGRWRWAEALRQPPGGRPCSRRAPPPPRRSQRGGGSGCGHLGERRKGGREGGRRERQKERGRERGRGGSERAERSAPRGIDRSSHGGRDPPPPPDSRSLRRGAGEKLRGGDTPVGAAHIRCEHNARQETEKTAQGRREAPVRPSFPRSLPPSVLLLLLLLLSPPPAPGQAPLSPAGRTRRRAGGRKQPHFLPFPSPLPIVPPAGQARPGGSPAGPGAAESFEPLPSAAPQGAGTGPGRAGPCRGRRSGAGSRAPGCRGAGSRELGAGSRAAILPGPCLAAGLWGVSLLFRGLGVPGAFRRCVGDAPECVGTVIAASRPQSRENCCGAPEFPSLPVPSLGARRMSQATSVVN